MKNDEIDFDGEEMAIRITKQ